MVEKKNITPMNIRDRIEALLRRRWLILAPIAISLGLSMIISLFFAPVYESSAFIQINDKKIVDPLVAGLAVPTTVKDQVELLVKELKSWPQLMKLVQQLHMADGVKSDKDVEDFVFGLRKRITIEDKGSNILQISFQDENPLMAQKVANTVAETLIMESARQRKDEAQTAINFIGEQLKVYKQKLEDSEKNFSTHKINSDLRVSMNKRSLLQGQISNLQKVIPSQVKTEHSPVFARMQAHLAELEVERARLLLDATEEHPRVKELNTEIEEIKKQLNEEMKKEMVSESVSMMNPSYMQAEQELKQVDMEIDYLQKRKKELEPQDEAEGKGISDEELSSLATNKRVDEDIYQMLLKQMESAYVSEQLQDTEKGARLRIIEYARLPVHPMKPIRLNVIIIGLVIGGLLGGGLVFAAEQLDRSFRTVEDAKNVLQMPALGSISRIIVKENDGKSMLDEIRNKLRGYVKKYRVLSDMRFISPHLAKKSKNSSIAPQVVLYHEPKSPVAEEYRILRTNIAGIKTPRNIRTLMVTSSVRGEGKSTTTMNLAVAMADSGRNVLLIDCDLRRGSIHQLLNVNPAPGLAQVLAGSAELEHVMVKTEVRNLTVMPCGSKPPKPSELLCSPRMETLLSSLRSKYDTILLDAPPVLNLPDTNVLNKYADAVLFVVQAERTQREEVIRACAMLHQAQAPVVGFALTNVQYYIPKYLYDYYYGDYGSHEQG